jgi:hypothetical protein
MFAISHIKIGQQPTLFICLYLDTEKLLSVHVKDIIRLLYKNMNIKAHVFVREPDDEHGIGRNLLLSLQIDRDK